MPRAVLFDVDGVLIHGYHTRPELQRRWDERLLEDLGIAPQAFKERFIFDVFVKKVIVGKLGLVEALDAVLPQLGYTGPTQRFIAYWLEHDSQLNAELVDVARRLKAAGTKLYIATNQEHLRAHWLWHRLRLGEVFDDMFYAARLGVTKPQPRFYAEVDRRLGPQHEPPLFFDDSPEVVAAAQKAGWEAVVYDGLADCTGHPWIAERLDSPAARPAPRIAIRPFRSGDGAALAALHRRAILATSRQFYSADDLESWAHGRHPGIYDADGSTIEVATDADGRPVGFCQSRDSQVLALYVDPDFQHCGAGTDLMRRAEARALAAGIRQISIHASVSAVAFYERRGYQMASENAHRTRGGRMLESAWMTKWFPPDVIVTSR